MDSVDLETPLSKWMRETNTSAYEIARRSKISYKQVCKIRDGESFPSLVSAFRIDAATEGKVAPVMWLGTPLGRKHWNEAHDWEKWQEQRKEEQRRNRQRNEAAKLDLMRDLTKDQDTKLVEMMEQTAALNVTDY